jgi:hypothetical protein
MGIVPPWWLIDVVADHCATRFSRSRRDVAAALGDEIVRSRAAGYSSYPELSAFTNPAPPLERTGNGLGGLLGEMKKPRGERGFFGLGRR